MPSIDPDPRRTRHRPTMTQIVKAWFGFLGSMMGVYAIFVFSISWLPEELHTLAVGWLIVGLTVCSTHIHRNTGRSVMWSVQSFRDAVRFFVMAAGWPILLWDALP